MTMKSFIASASMTGALLTAGAAHAQDQGQTLILEFYGERSWEVSCTLIQSNGDYVETEEHAREGMATGRIAVRDVETGHCRYSTGQNAMLRVTFVTELTDFDCPFLYTEEDECRTYFAGESEGSFSIAPRAPVLSGS